MRVIVLVLIIALSSCKSMRTVMDSWLGQEKRTLIQSWGPPQSVSSDGGNGEVLIFSQNVYNPYYNTTSYQCKMFYVNSDGKIYHWLTRNSLVPPQQMQVNLNVHHTNY